MKAIITIGCSASGKSTWASKQVNYVDINRDEFRKQVLVSKHINPHNINMWSLWDFKWENEVTKFVDDEIEKCVKHMDNIIISDTNLNISRRNKLNEKLTKLGYTVEYKVFGEELTIDELWKRDEQRLNTVGRDVIARQYYEFRKEYPKYKLKGVTGKLDCIIYDIDGTVAHMTGRSPYDWSKVGTDIADDVILIGLVAQYMAGYEIKFMSGRDSVCYTDTYDWLVTNIRRVSKLAYGHEIDVQFELFMRDQEDVRKDTIIKEELFFKHIDGNYNVVCVYDDRPVVSRVWYDFGFKVIHCANPYIDF